MQINVPFTTMASFVTARNLSIQYVLCDGIYHLAAIDGAIELDSQINTNGSDPTDLTNFTNNYLPTANAILAANGSSTGTIAALNGTIVATVRGGSSVSFSVTGTWAANIVIEASLDNVNWDPWGFITLPGTLGSSLTSNGVTVSPCGGFVYIRLRASTYTSGTIDVLWNVSGQASAVQAYSPIASNFNVLDASDGPVTAGAAALSASLVAAFYGSTLPTLGNGQQVALQTDVNGRLIVESNPVTGFKATYSASITNLASAASATDILTITGSATKTIKVMRITISGTTTTQGWQDILLIKRSAANTAGTSTAPTIVSRDSTNAAATATVLAYTANPTLGAAIGTMNVQKYYMPIAASGGNQVGANDFLRFDLADGPVQAVTLRGTTQVLAVNLNGVTIAGPAFDIDIIWTEE